MILTAWRVAIQEEQEKVMSLWESFAVQLLKVVKRVVCRLDLGKKVGFRNPVKLSVHLISGEVSSLYQGIRMTFEELGSHPYCFYVIRVTSGKRWKNVFVPDLLEWMKPEELLPIRIQEDLFWKKVHQEVRWGSLEVYLGALVKIRLAVDVFDREQTDLMKKYFVDPWKGLLRDEAIREYARKQPSVVIPENSFFEASLSKNLDAWLEVGSPEEELGLISKTLSWALVCSVWKQPLSFDRVCALIGGRFRKDISDVFYTFVKTCKEVQTWALETP